MASIYSIKPRFQALLRPGVTSLARAGVRPNAITLLAVLGSIAVGLVVGFSGRSPLLLLLPAWLFLRMALNAMDGMLAREHGMTTRSGAVLNELGDVLADLGLYLPLVWVAPEASGAIVAFSFGAVLTEFSGLLGVAVGAGRRYDGPMGKSDRAFLVGLLALVTTLLPAVWKFWGWVFAAATLLTVWTCANRVRRALATAPRD